MRLLVDMNLSPRWIGVLGDAGIEATHWSMLGAHNAPDAEIMAYASVNECVVLTYDLDFSAILAATHGEKPSVVQIRAEDVSPEAIGRQIIAALKQMSPELNHGALITVEPNRTRLRLLPLRLRDQDQLIKPIDAGLAKRVRALVNGVKVEIDAPLDPADE